MARKVFTIEQKSLRWAEKEKDLLAAYRSGVADGTADYVQLVLDKTRTEQMVNLPSGILRKSELIQRKIKGKTFNWGDQNKRSALIQAGLRLNGSQAINRSHATESALRSMRFSISNSGIVTGKNQDGNISFQLSPVTGRFVGFIDVTGKVGTAMKVMINKFRIRVLSAGASKANTYWKKMVQAGLQKNMQKRFGALNR